jgi:hypothetical protein
MKKLIIPILATFTLTLPGCFIDDKPVAVNHYSVKGISSPVDISRDGVSTISNPERKVHIGHDIPVNIELNAEYADDDVPVQFYLLNVDDIEEVESGIGEIGDIRMYYIDRTPFTTIDHVDKGTKTYYLTITIPSDDAKDPLTGDYKTGTFCVVGEVNKSGEAEVDAYQVYKKFKSSLSDPDYRKKNTINVTTEYLSKPDLSIEAMNFTGGAGDGLSVLTYLDLDLGKLPGASQFTINVPGVSIANPLATPFHIIPSEAERTFMGSIQLLSSSCDSLNVPVKFTLKGTVTKPDGSTTDISIKLLIYDSDIGGWTETYYVPLLKANVIERVNLALRIPDDGDIDKADLDASAIRELIGDGDVYHNYSFQIEGAINPSGSIKEARFISAKEGEYDPSGNNSTLANNTKDQNIVINIDKMEVEPNEGIKLYPYDKITPVAATSTTPAAPTDNDKQLVIFWDGFSYKVGDGDFGGSAQMHEGCLFRNFSLYSLGANVNGTIFNNNFTLIDAYLNAICTPKQSAKTAFDFHVEAAKKTYFSDFGAGFSNNDWNYPITLFSKSYEKEKWVYCFKFKISAGLDVIFTPGITLDLNYDGSLKTSKYMTLVASVNADASVSVDGLAGVGIYAYCDVFSLELNQNTYTKTKFQNFTVNETGSTQTIERVSGTVYRDFGMYLTGPTGYFDLYLEINFIFFSKRWSWEIYRYSSPRIPIVDFNIDPQSGKKWTTYLNY